MKPQQKEYKYLSIKESGGKTTYYAYTNMCDSFWCHRANVGHWQLGASSWRSRYRNQMWLNKCGYSKERFRKVSPLELLIACGGPVK